ncbi:S8 family serine peptidase [Streptomyces sp. BBFR51]|uniref:S8 family serine peptidase n=1 Tax=Streptomyces sp. BBFR51 TaxID=3372856 RepID=UPI0037DD5DAA
MSQAVDRLSAQTGALFVVAAGNAGETGTIGAPGVATSALTVGAVHSTDTVAPFSSQPPGSTAR